MPELRKDPVIGRWVVISTERGKRPLDFGRREATPRSGLCPFCEGNEDKTPPEILAFRDGGKPNSPGWRVRVVPNKFPALVVEGPLRPKGVGLYDMMNGIGAHEVIIETPRHDRTLSDFSVGELDELLLAYQSRLNDLQQDQRFRYLLLFKNQGEEAGASLEHSHTQLIATPIVPKRVIEELDGTARHFQAKERCIFCDILDQELWDGRRVVAENPHFAALAPFAARFPFETWILPKSHASHFAGIDAEQRRHFAAILSTVLRKLDVALDGPAYNYAIHTAPVNDRRDWYFHWHIEIMPKVTKVAGFEWGSGFYINPTPPEEAAEYLRELRLDPVPTEPP
ncbi:MAG: galactose-1-phosphate uridylyltransferase [Candidatus Krumholzibacteriota bacterium]|nr:galactose-1-phosphate uridylyltransferase [Candidatus Krumholzibacteriota bacterium]